MPEDHREYQQRDTDRLFRQNADQYQKIHDNQQSIGELRAELGRLKVDLIGETGNNGLRGEFKTFRAESQASDADILRTLHTMQEKQSANLKWMAGLVVGVPGTIFAISRVADVL